MDGEIRFDDLQRESDHQRYQFLRHEIEMCNVFCDVAETEHHIGERATALRSLTHAERACENIAKFVADPAHGGRLDAEQYREIREGLLRLRERIGALSRIIDGAQTNP
jgi:hypothetical protein